jgi:antitoxin (DNA-binding transcriptional repressor) of toxin-antitoxin stability system
MKFINIRDFRENTSAIRKEMDVDREEIVLTVNGQPSAIVTPVDSDNLEEQLAAIRRARAAVAIDRARQIARERGLDKMSMKEVDDLVRSWRRTGSGKSSGKPGR